MLLFFVREAHFSYLYNIESEIVRFSRYLAISRATCKTALYDGGKSIAELAAATGGDQRWAWGVWGVQPDTSNRG